MNTLILVACIAGGGLLMLGLLEVVLRVIEGRHERMEAEAEVVDLSGPLECEDRCGLPACDRAAKARDAAEQQKGNL